MKKTYIIPQTEVLRLAPTRLIAESPMDLNDDTEQALEQEDILVKGNSFNIWGDDDWDD